MAPDKKALRILIQTYWSPKGWRREPVTDPNDFAYARSKGYMFDPVRLAHDQIVERLLAARSAVDRSQVAEAFVASLSTRRLELQSALASMAFSTHFPDHRIASVKSERTQRRRNQCLVCGQYDWMDQRESDLHD